MNMTETDNPKVREHIEPKLEQRMKRLSEATINEKDINNWFESREIKPTSGIFVYNSTSKRYEFMRGSQSVTHNTTSAAAATLTCPAGHRYIVKLVNSNDDTTAVSYSVVAAINGTNISLLADGNAVGIDERQTLIGAPFFVEAAGTMHAAVMGPIELNAGDSISVTATGFVALDGRSTVFLYEDITMG